MVRVIIERKLKKREPISKLLQQIRGVAMTQPGYVSSEILVNTEDTSLIMIISTWDDIKSWNKWAISGQRIAIDREIDLLLEQPQTIKTYNIILPEEIEFLEDPEGWLQKREHHSLDG